MNTLSNVTSKRGKQSPPCTGLTPCVSSVTSCDGVSVGYAPDPSKKWYVMRMKLVSMPIVSTFVGHRK